jgi:hypothetical protein
MWARASSPVRRRQSDQNQTTAGRLHLADHSIREAPGKTKFISVDFNWVSHGRGRPRVRLNVLKADLA